MKNKLYIIVRRNKRMRFVTLVVFILFFVGFYNIFSQSVSMLENKYSALKYSYDKESGTIDSLKQILNERAKEIDIAKKKKDVDENSIKQMMSSTVTISNKIDEHQRIIAKIENELENVKRLLGKKYTTEIDSLSALEKSDKYEGSKDEIKARILTLTEKRILVAPKINLLSFNPEKMLGVNLANSQSAEERNIYNEYLNEALNEVNNQLGQIKKLNDEVSQIITLQQKTKKFLEETEFDSDIRAMNIITHAQQNVSSTGAGVLNDKFTNITSQAQSFIFLLQQLDLKQNTDLKTRNRFQLDSLKKELTIKEYKELLEEVERKLIDYRLILTHKINVEK